MTAPKSLKAPYMPMIHNLLRALGSFLLSLAVIAAIAGAFRFGMEPAIAGIFDLDEQSRGYVRRIGMLCSFVLGYWIYTKYIERRAGKSDLVVDIPSIGLGILSGVAIIGLPMLLLYFAGYYRYISYSGLDAVLGVGLVILAAAILEELLFRGALFVISERYFGTIVALVSQTLLFAGLHMFNDNLGGWLSILSTALIGGMWTLMYMVRRNIWMIGLHHAAWNFTIFMTGLPLTGQEDWRAAAPMQSDFAGSRWMTGGAAGPEESILVLIVVAVIVGLLIRKSMDAKLIWLMPRQTVSFWPKDRVVDE